MHFEVSNLSPVNIHIFIYASLSVLMVILMSSYNSSSIPVIPKKIWFNSNASNTLCYFYFIVFRFLEAF